MKYNLESLKKAYKTAKDMKKINFGMEIQKFDEEKRMVYGYASTEKMDCQGEIVTKAAMENAWEEYMKFGNIREMHQPSAVGIVKEYEFRDEGVFIGVYVSDDSAWKKVVDGVYKGFSIGGAALKKVGSSILDLLLIEISLVDRPANSGALITLFKMSDFENIEVEENDEEILSNLKDLIKSGLSLEQIVEIVNKSQENNNSEKLLQKEKLLSKGFYEIKDVIESINILNWVLDDKEWEQKWQNDDNTEILVSLKQQIVSLTELAQQMLMNETKDLVGVEDSVVELNEKIKNIIKFKVEVPTDDKEEKITKMVSDNETLSNSYNLLKSDVEAKDKEIQELKDKILILNKNAIFEKKSDISTAKKENVDNINLNKTMTDVINDIEEEAKEIKEKIEKATGIEKDNLVARLNSINLRKSQIRAIS